MDNVNEPVSGHEDPAGEDPWAMQLVVRVEKTSPPSHTAVCEAAAMAVVCLLADERATSDSVWVSSIARWMDGRIRKHVRRARGAAWDNVQMLPGVTVEHSGASVRAFVPCSTRDVPKEVAKLQMQGLDLKDSMSRPAGLVPAAGCLVVSICPDPVLPTGKAAAAAGHAAQIAWMRMPVDRLALWSASGFPVVVEHPASVLWEELRQVAPVEVVDAGFTVVAPQTTTALAHWL